MEGPVQTVQPANYENPFRPGAGHAPPFLAGRVEERNEFLKLLDQRPILSNLLLTGLRGVGKTVLLDTFKPLAQARGWLWVGADLSESTTVDEERIATRILSDLAVVTSNAVYAKTEIRRLGFGGQSDLFESTLTYATLEAVYNRASGLVADKLKTTFEFVWNSLSASPTPPRGIVFAYDEAQNMADQASKEQYPLSVMLDVFQSTQRKGIPFLLALTGLPTIQPKLVEARTYSERMFRVVFLTRLDPPDVREAIVRPIKDRNSPITLTEDSIRQIEKHSAGYPYFIQFICREVFDVFLAQLSSGTENPSVPIGEITRKLDSDFFMGRWSRVTDRQRDLLYVASMLESNEEEEFTVQDLLKGAKGLQVKKFSASHASQLLAVMIESGIVYRNRHGKYSFAVPLLAEFIRRQYPQEVARL